MGTEAERDERYLAILLRAIRAVPPATPSGVQRTWSTSEVAAYLGLGDASTFSSGIACQLYIQRDRPYRWIVSLCHR